MNLSELVRPEDLNAALTLGLVSARTSDDGALTIYNYTDSAMYTPGAWDNPAAVSYTHLDVYKRQAQPRLRLRRPRHPEPRGHPSMSTDLARYEVTSPAPVALRDYQSDAVRRLGEWAESASAAFQIAERLVQTSFVPAAFRGKPVEAAAAILAGVEVGLQPMAALRSFDVISGQAAARAITLRAIVQSHGHEIEVIESTATRCVMRGRRRGASDWQKVTWTIDRARDLQLTGKDLSLIHI